MIKENKVLMAEAREALVGKWGFAAVVTLVYYIVGGAASKIPLVPLVIAGPLLVGFSFIFIRLAKKEVTKIEDLFKGFNNFSTTFVAFLLTTVYTLLWMLLLIIPGIIASISYSQTFFILAEDGTLTASQAIEKSKKMMDGNKWKYFCLSLRFIGWTLLAILTIGIGFFWLVPYIMVTYAKFYEGLKHNHAGHVEHQAQGAHHANNHKEESAVSTSEASTEVAATV